LQQHDQVISVPGIVPVAPKPASASASSEEERPSVSPLPSGGEGPGVRGLNDQSPRPARGRRWIAAAAVLVALLAGLSLTEATGVTNVRGTVIQLFSPDGTLIVEVDDSAISVTIDGSDVVLTGAGAKEIRLKPGPYKLLATKDGRVVRQELVHV